MVVQPCLPKLIGPTWNLNLIICEYQIHALVLEKSAVMCFIQVSDYNITKLNLVN